jgi:hypothetical protein
MDAESAGDPDRSDQLSGVSCVSATTCVAVGDVADTSGLSTTLVEAWNGASWTIQSTPNPATSSNSHLTSDSCGSANACTAAGNYYDTTSHNVLPLVEAWNGVSWTIQSTPSPTGAGYSGGLWGVSCATSSNCTAVGEYDDTPTTAATMAEVWNGTVWTIQSSVAPGAYGSVLLGVSCSSTTDCTAVGGSTNSLGAELTLAEAESG